MDANHVNTFVEAVINILETTATLSVKARRPYLKKDSVATGNITCNLKLTGDINGTVSISFTSGSILNIVSNMFGEEMTEMNEEISDAVGEIANMISGQVTTKFAEMEKTLKVETSSIQTEEKHMIEHDLTHPVIAMPYIAGKGELTIEVCFEES